MQVYNGKTGFDKQGGCVLALGSFDALHIAHQALIREAAAQARQRQVRAGVYLFDTRPECVLFPEQTHKSLYTNEDKADIIDALGMDFLYFETFDAKFMRLDNFEFAKLLKERFDVLCVVVGFHYSFGFQGKGNAEKLLEYGKILGFDVAVLEPVTQDDALISSTLVRDCVANGDIELANRLLDRPYTLRGAVVRDRGVGTKMGMPTANLAVDDSLLLPQNGVYATYSVIDGQAYASVTNIGVRPTFSLDKVVVETHLLDFQGNLDGDTLTISFIKRLRDEKKFNTKEELAQQIFSDIDEAKTLFRTK